MTTGFALVQVKCLPVWVHPSVAESVKRRCKLARIAGVPAFAAA